MVRKGQVGVLAGALQSRVSRLREVIVAPGWRHWAWVLALTLLGTFLGHRAGQTGFLIDLRYRLHQHLTDLGARPLHVRHTALVVVTDDDYWRGQPAGRRPIKRDYLAKLLLAVAEANPAVIALDFDLSAPDPVSGAIPSDYRAETAELVAAIRKVAAPHRRVVLPQTIGGRFPNYVVEPDVHDGGGFCPKKPPAVRRDDVFCGYIALDHDVRRLPPTIRMDTGLHLDSFAVAVARARNPASVDDTRPMAVAYGSFMPFVRYRMDDAVVTASAVMSGPEERRKLQHRAVLIGAMWSRFAYGRGPVVDGHPSPVDVIPGVLVHANYAEAILDGRSYPELPKWVGFGVEVALVLAAALVLVVDLPVRRKALILMLLAAGLVLLWYVLFQNFGRFFDGLIPLVMVAGHAAFEQVRKWRDEALSARLAAQDRLASVPPGVSP